MEIPVPADRLSASRSGSVRGEIVTDPIASDTAAVTAAFEPYAPVSGGRARAAAFGKTNGQSQHRTSRDVHPQKTTCPEVADHVQSEDN